MVGQTRQHTADSATESVSRALDELKEALPPLENLIEAFRGVLVEKARLKAEISLVQEMHPAVPDPARFEQGVPLASWGDLIDFDGPLWMKAADGLMPSMAKGFPKLAEDIQKLRKALEDDELDPQAFLKAMAEDRSEEMEAAASRINVAPGIMELVLGTVMKPLVEKRAELLKPLITGLLWQRGYCPLCGSMPELAFLRGKEGQKWLRCSLCANEWRFGRLVCAFCDNTDQEKLLTYYIADRDRERVEVCQRCNRYVPCLDLRDRSSEPLLEVAALGLVHLDILAQQKGFLPAAVCAWNQVTDDVMASDFSNAVERRPLEEKAH